MVRRTTTELVQEEVALLAVPVSLDDTGASTKRFRADAMDKAFTRSYCQPLYVFEESYSDGLVQGNVVSAIRGTAPPTASRVSNARSGSTLEDLPDGKKGATCPFPSQPSGIGKRKRDAHGLCEDFSREPRIMRTIRLARLTPIDKLESDILFRAYSDVMFCHRALWKMGIYHRDSAANVMWDSMKENGVLIDFDLATSVNQTTTSDEHRISGTLPFMALELLTDRGMKGLIPPLYRHELESFTWVLIYLCYTVTKRDDGKFALCVNKLIEEWFLSTKPGHIQAAKLNLDQSLDDLEPKPLLYAHYAPLARTLLRFWTSQYHKRTGALLDYKDAQGKPHTAAGGSSCNLDNTNSDRVAPVPYNFETDEELLWMTLVEKHQQTVKEEDKIHLDGLLEAYRTTRWPEPIESLDDENDAIIITAQQDNI